MSALQDRSAHEYILGADGSERLRLLAQSEIHRAQAERLFERLSVRPGGHALDLGCGPLGVLDLLSSLVGSGGEAIGLDNEPQMLAHGERTIAERNLTSVRLVLGDATRTELADGWCDLAHERLVLINHPAPRDIVAEMSRVVCPGGRIAVQEVDMLSWACEPAHPAWERLLSVLVLAWRAAGLDPFIGRRLAGLLREAGLTEVGFDAQAHLWCPGHPYQTLLLKFIDIFRNRILGSGLLAEDALNELSAELQEHLARPDTLVIHPLFFQAWGRKPV